MNIWWEECPAISAEREMFEIKQMLLDNSSPITMRLMEILTTQVGGIIQISHGRPEQLSTNSRINHLNNLQCKKREDFLLNPPKPKGVHEVESQEGESSQMKDVKALITLRSGKKIEKPTPKPHVEKEEEIKKGRKWKTKRESVKRRRTMIQQ
ncbi:hypothetical protein CK203_017903 [Vitis vinifera]|uniref:Uncharacterized protein n=1 Tax=Vitis vinifera TaxID=29760 RepID=A0A438JVW4_VITVI|nr:hypothetical protein CK203_017903 [Vitis vinifera]